MSTGTEGNNEENLELYVPGYVFATALNNSAKADNHRVSKVKFFLWKLDRNWSQIIDLKMLIHSQHAMQLIARLNVLDWAIGVLSGKYYAHIDIVTTVPCTHRLRTPDLASLNI